MDQKEFTEIKEALVTARILSYCFGQKQNFEIDYKYLNDTQVQVDCQPLTRVNVFH